MFISKKKYKALLESSGERKVRSYSKEDNVWLAYNRLQNAFFDKKARKIDLIAAIKEAIEYLDNELGTI